MHKRNASPHTAENTAIRFKAFLESENLTVKARNIGSLIPCRTGDERHGHDMVDTAGLHRNCTHYIYCFTEPIMTTGNILIVTILF